MSDIGAMVDLLIAAGTPPAVAAQVIAQAFAAGAAAGNFRGIPVDDAAEKRRAYDRERKRKSAEIHRTSTGTPRTSESASLSKESKKEEIKEEVGARKKAFRGNRLPDDWQPSPQDRAVADELLGEQKAAGEIAKFHDHWKQQPGNKGVKLDWNAAWRNWIRRAAEYAGGRNGQRTNGFHPNSSAGPAPTRDAAVITGMGRALDRRRADRAAANGNGELRGHPDAAGGDDPGRAAASGDDGAPGQLALIPAGHAGE